MKKLLIFLSFLISFSAFTQRGMFMQSQQITHSTFFGINIQGVTPDEEIRICKDSLHVKYIRDAVILQTYHGGIDVGLQKKFNAGIRTLLNFNWSGGGGSGGAKGFPKGADLVTFRTRLNQFLTDNTNILDGLIAVIENEPYNGQFFNYDEPNLSTFNVVQDYLNELEVAVEVCHDYNIQVMDGASHMTYYQQIIDQPPPSSNDAARRGDSGLIGYRAININYTNYHFNAPGGLSNGNAAMRAGVVRTLAEWVWGYSGHYPVSNEWHQTDDGTVADQNALCASIVTSQRQAHIRYAINFSGDGGSQAIPFVNLTTLVLTPIGRAYRDAIASGQ